jgi:cytochrome c-type biogenesis protein
LNQANFLLAFSGGLLSFLSPCVLPLVPGYIAYIAGNAVEHSDERQSKIGLLFRALLFVLGFSTVFILLGASVTALSQVLFANKILFQKVGGVVIIIMGIHLTGLIKWKFLYREKRLLNPLRKGRNIGPYFIGMAFAAGWTPCIGPILSSILIFAGNMDTFGTGLAMLIFYSLGMGVPFMLVAALIEKFTEAFKRFSKFMPYVSIISGVLLVAMGLLIFTGNIGILGNYLDFIDYF